MAHGLFIIVFALIYAFHFSAAQVEALDITIEEPTQQPFYAVKGREFNIKCIVKGAPNDKISWYHNDVLINSNTQTGFDMTSFIKEGVLTGILNKQNVTKEDAGRYKCEEIQSTQNYNIVIMVSEIKPIHDIAKPSESASLQCEVKGDLVQGKYQMEWQRDGSVLQNTPDKYLINDLNHTIEIMNIDFKQDLGAYHCVIKVENDQTYNFTAFVYGAAYVEHFEKSKNLVQDDALNLTCKAAGYPVPTVTWSHDKHRINATSDRVSYTNYGDVLNASVKISKMQFEDAGEYSCEASNNIEDVPYNATAHITVRVKEMNPRAAANVLDKFFAAEDDKLAALWPFLGICLEVTILCIIIFFYERHRNKKLAEEDAKEEADHLTNSHAKSDDVRQRKV